MRLIPLTLTLFATLLLATACGDDSGESTGTSSSTPAEPDRVTFMAGFKPQANLPFVGAYVAQEKGYFADENLDVEIQHVTTPGDNFRLMAAGEVDISTADAPALLEKWVQDPPLPVVSLALIGQTGQQGFAVLADSGIETPADWAGRRAGYKGGAVTPDYLAILEANNIYPASIETVRVGFEPQVLTEGQVDIYPVFVANEPDTLRRLGYETKVFTAADYGAPTLGLAYVATPEFIAENSDVTARFVRAALHGIEYAADNPEEAIDIVLQFAPQEDREHQRYMLDTELEMAAQGAAEEGGFGFQTEEQWQELQDYLARFSGLPAPIDDITQVFTTEFLQEQ